MAHRKCFSNESDKINSGIYTSRKKARTIYHGGLDLAKNGGVYHKNTNGKQKGTYVGDVKVSQDGSNCLNGASSYETLLSVTQGKYLVSPDTFDLRTNSDIWTGNLYVRDMSGSGFHTIDASAGGIPNTFTYPPDPNINNTYPTPSNDNGGLIVDPCFNVFYPSDVSTYGSCYLKNERAYQKDLSYIDYTKNKGLIHTYIGNNNGYTGSFAYPQKFVFDCNPDPIVIPGGVMPSSGPEPGPSPPDPGPDTFFAFDGSYTEGIDYQYLVQNGSSSVSDKYSIISVLPAADGGVTFHINPISPSDWTDYQVGVVLVGPGETKETPIYGQGILSENYEGGKGGASIYADFSANEILTNEITLICGITNTQSDPLMYSSMEISNTNTLWTCGHTLNTQAGGSNITYTVQKESAPTGGSAGGDSGWTDSTFFMGSDISLNGYGGGGGSGNTGGGTTHGNYGQAGQNGTAGLNGGDIASMTPYDKNGASGTGTGGGGSYPNDSAYPPYWTSPGHGGSGLVYFYIGYKASESETVFTLTDNNTISKAISGPLSQSSYSNLMNINAIKYVAVGNGVTSISNDGFQNCSSLTQITIPPSVTSIGTLAFQNSGLETANMTETTCQQIGIQDPWVQYGIPFTPPAIGSHTVIGLDDYTFFGASGVNIYDKDAEIII